VPGDFGDGIDAAQIDQHRLLHQRLQPLKVKRTELFAFGDEDVGVGVFRDLV
jgi:hypothetical protein